MSGRIRAHGKQENREGTEQSKETIRKYSSMSQNISVERDKHKTWMWRKSDVQQHPCIVIIIYQHLRTAAQKHLQADETLSKPQWTNYKNVIMEWKTGLCVPVAFCRCDCFIQLKQNEHTKTNEWPKKKKKCYHSNTLCCYQDCAVVLCENYWQEFCWKKKSSNPTFCEVELICIAISFKNMFPLNAAKWQLIGRQSPSAWLHEDNNSVEITRQIFNQTI